MVSKIDLGETYYNVDIDASTNNGILRFTKEATIVFREYSDGVIRLSHGDILTSGGWFTYSHKELNILNDDYPGIIDAAIEELREHFSILEEDKEVEGLEEV